MVVCLLHRPQHAFVHARIVRHGSVFNEARQRSVNFPAAVRRHCPAAIQRQARKLFAPYHVFVPGYPYPREYAYFGMLLRHIGYEVPKRIYHRHPYRPAVPFRVYPFHGLRAMRMRAYYCIRAPVYQLRRKPALGFVLRALMLIAPMHHYDYKLRTRPRASRYLTFYHFFGKPRKRKVPVFGVYLGRGAVEYLRCAHQSYFYAVFFNYARRQEVLHAKRRARGFYSHRPKHVYRAEKARVVAVHGMVVGGGNGVYPRIEKVLRQLVRRAEALHWRIGGVRVFLRRGCNRFARLRIARLLPAERTFKVRAHYVHRFKHALHRQKAFRKIVARFGFCVGYLPRHHQYVPNKADRSLLNLRRRLWRWFVRGFGRKRGHRS